MHGPMSVKKDWIRPKHR